MIRFKLLCVTLVGWLAAGAVTITPTGAGQVEALLGDAPESSVVIHGPVSFADLNYLASLDNIRSLDLSNASITLYRADAQFYPENVLPTGIFAGAKFTKFVLPSTERLVVEDAAFAGAEIEEIVIPASVASVGQGAFAGSALKAVTLNGQTRFAESVFADCTALESVDLGGLTSLPPRFFSGCTALKSIKGAGNVVEIGDRAFRGATSLVSFDFGPDLKSVGTEAFAGAGLGNADLSRASSIVALAPRVFADNAKLHHAAFPSALQDLGEGAFFGCPALAKVDAYVTEIPDYAFVNDTSLDITTVYTPSTSAIGAYALKGLDQVVQLNLYPALAYIGDNAMQGMSNLESIDARELTSLPELGDNVWENVRQELVKLYAFDETADAFASTPQWQEFDIVKLSSTLSVDQGVNPGIEARFEGTTLEIRSRQEIYEIVLYDPAGMMLARLMPQSNVEKIETSQWETHIYIVGVTLSDGIRATAKLIRK